ncbi:MAG: chitin-binding domain-containing protein [Arenibacterium sp.]
MTIKTVVVAFTLTCLPVVGFAMGCSEGSHQAQSCADGAVWDAESQSCVKQITG